MPKKRKKRRLKISRVIFALVFLAAIAVGIYYFAKIPVRGFYVTGNTYYNDQEILEKTNLIKYPSYLLTNSLNVSRKVRRDELIQNIKIKHKLNGMFEVIVNENKVLFYDEIKKKSVLENAKEIDYYDENIQVVINEVDSKKIYKKFIEKFPILNSDIVKNISEIKYDPNDLDKERFLFSMNDGNYVYATLTKFSNINKYLEISNTLEGKKGILYLDYGNYFVPKE